MWGYRSGRMQTHFCFFDVGSLFLAMEQQDILFQARQCHTNLT